MPPGLPTEAPALAPPARRQQQGAKLTATPGVCSGCHTVRGTSVKGTLGPNLPTSAPARASRRSRSPTRGQPAMARDPQAMKPGNAMIPHLSNDEITADLAELDTLK